ncbi:patatin-like phospholipase family protein [Caldimonas tepidiphila]|uniref:patatin-like phospholipase family protein n=1 Tax=Caldimonas tepidiphila TaxID=2315841 RepID=UPI00147649F5|nr:patatin-like phospholipase family protein [Caldimonas tepidiphila]
MNGLNGLDWVGAPLRLDLALQGGGSHGAFTWGVLDRLLEDEDFAIGGVSGTSAGALNAAVLATGLVRGGRAGAREALRRFWQDVSAGAQVFSPFALSQSRAAADNFNFDRLASYRWIGNFLRTFSPYEFNPLNLNPLRDMVQRHVDEEVLRHCHERRGADDDGLPLRLFVTATAVRTGQARVFSGGELGVDALLASACLPMMFQAVEIEGEPYWDGGYSGNPAIFPLLQGGEGRDVLLVKINPLRRDATPTRSTEILERLGEITFNAGLLAEMRAIEAVSRLLREQPGGACRALRLHMVADDEGLAPFNASSKFNTDAAFIGQLFALGRAAAQRWIERCKRDVGRRSSLDIRREFLLPPACLSSA